MREIRAIDDSGATVWHAVEVMGDYDEMIWLSSRGELTGLVRHNNLGALVEFHLRYGTDVEIQPSWSGGRSVFPATIQPDTIAKLVTAALQEPA